MTTLRSPRGLRLGCLLLANAFVLPTAHAQFTPETFTDALKDGSQGPEMVVIAGGNFMIGDRNGNGPDDEKPVREIAIKGFAMGRYEVTFAEFDRFVAATSKRPPDDESFGRGNMPVMNVSWEDANGYAHWLSQQTGHNYRLPSEAQWEFAARAGSNSTFFWGNDASQACFYANVADTTAIGSNSAWLQVNCEDGYSELAQVGQFPPNPFGLFDMIGNVSEWVQDCYNDNYDALPADGRPSENAYCRKRVARGGAWSSPAWHLRSSHRQAFSTNERRHTLGFRVLRVLNEDELAQFSTTRSQLNDSDDKESGGGLSAFRGLAQWD